MEVLADPPPRNPHLSPLTPPPPEEPGAVTAAAPAPASSSASASRPVRAARKLPLSFLLLFVLLLAAASVAGLKWWQYRQMPASRTSPLTPPSPRANQACTEEAKRCPDGTYVGRTGPNCEFAVCDNPGSQRVSQQGWKALQQDTFTVAYPLDFTMRFQDGSILLIKEGSTQLSGTEGTDGILMALRVEDSRDLSLPDFVSERVKEATATAKLTKPPQEMMLANVPAFTYELAGLGTYTEYAVQKDTASPFILLIAVFAPDPQNRGYQKTVEDILQTLTIVK